MLVELAHTNTYVTEVVYICRIKKIFNSYVMIGSFVVLNDLQYRVKYFKHCTFFPT